MSRRYYLYKRGSTYYAKLVNPTNGKILEARSTHTQNEDEANLEVAKWLLNGIPQGSGNKETTPIATAFKLEDFLSWIKNDQGFGIPETKRVLSCLEGRGLVIAAVAANERSAELVSDFLLRFWDYEKSPYIKEKLAHGQRIGRLHASDSLKRVNRYWVPYFKGKRLGEVRRADVRAFSLSLAEFEISPATINYTMLAGTTALRWAFQNELIPSDPTLGVKRFSGKAKKRGVLTVDEAKRLFDLSWDDERSKIGNMLAMTTGLRAGEIVGLQLRDILEDRLNIQHAWACEDGLKTPKNGETRQVPLLPEIRDDLLKLALKNPHRRGGEGFVFYSTSPDAPMDRKVLLKGLSRGLIRLVAGDCKDDASFARAVAYWKERNVVFHSWRHFYSSRMADQLDARKVMQATGHKSAAVFQAYAEHAEEKNFLDVQSVMGKIFDFLPKSKEKVRDSA